MKREPKDYAYDVICDNLKCTHYADKRGITNRPDSVFGRTHSCPRIPPEALQHKGLGGIFFSIGFASCCLISGHFT
jgi:hypothetical protein